MANTLGQDPEVDDIAFGPRVADQGPSPRPSPNVHLRGKYVTLTGIQEEDAHSLWTHLDLPSNPHLFYYLPSSAPTSAAELWQRLCSLRDERGFVIFSIKANPCRLGPVTSSTSGAHGHTETIGTLAYLDIQPENRAIEVGLVVFSPMLQRTVAATEAHYLMLQHAFGSDATKLSPPYRRVVWKCHARNHLSKRAAERLGFTYEGTFRNHMIVRGRSRDSHFLSIIDDEWPNVCNSLKAWLQDTNFDANGRQIKSLDECRQMCSKE